MDGIDHLEHLDRQLVDELAQVACEAVRDELREQTRKQRRTAALYATSGAVARYAGAALALTLGLALAAGLPDWAAALVTAAILGVLAHALRNLARPGPSRAHTPAGHGDPAAVRPPSGLGMPAPPVPSVPPLAPGSGTGAAAGPAPGTFPPGAPRRDDIDPEAPHHRGVTTGAPTRRQAWERAADRARSAAPVPAEAPQGRGGDRGRRRCRPGRSRGLRRPGRPGRPAGQGTRGLGRGG